jgi:hypothetical protein
MLSQGISIPKGLQPERLRGHYLVGIGIAHREKHNQIGRRNCPSRYTMTTRPHNQRLTTNH